MDDRFAVVGIAGRYPGAPDLDAFWRVVRDARDTSAPAPPRRPGPSPLAAGQRGHFLEHAADFDAEFFGLAPRDAARLDPQQRLFLETAHAALEDAGLTGARLDTLAGPGGTLRSVGVYVGVASADYALLGARSWAAGSPEGPAEGPARLPSRLAALLGLTGPGQVVDTADSSGLTAVHLAVEALRRGTCAAAVAGGVELLLHPARGRDGAGEGVGAVVLKPLRSALADGDQVHAVIRATATGTLGPAPSTAPGGGPLLRETRQAALRRVGDAGAATGLAALTAAVLQLRHGVLAPARAGAGATPWPRAHDATGRTLPRAACVETPGPDGCPTLGARLVLEEHLPTAAPAPAAPDPADAREELVLLCAPTPAHLRATAARLAAWLDPAAPPGATAADRPALASVARTLRAGRASGPCRLAVLAHDTPALAAALHRFAADSGGPGDSADRAGGPGAAEVRCVDLRARGADPLRLAAAPETRDYLAALWRSGRLEQLTGLWLSGVDVPWPALEARSGAGSGLVPLPPSALLRRPLWRDSAPAPGGAPERGSPG